jgi:hypothetical protein
MDNNFAKKTAPSTRPSRRGRSIKYPLDEVLETREHYMAVRDFVMSHPEIEYGEILRSNSKLVKELKNVVFGQTV